jgi:hypothetical protein
MLQLSHVAEIPPAPSKCLIMPQLKCPEYQGRQIVPFGPEQNLAMVEKDWSNLDKKIM